jgi:hypothetical protein
MSIELSVKLQELQERLKGLEEAVALRADADVSAIYERLKAVEQWIADRKPGPKTK